MQPDPLEGTPYRALMPLGSGGMGEVVEAEQVERGDRVVVKLLHRHLLARRDLADRMRLEAEALGCVQHPNVVRGIDHGFAAGQRPYLVMERLTGCTLQEELASRGKLPAAEAIDIAVQVLDGLEAVHRAGIVHRDLKLENIFLCAAAPGVRRVAKLLDLGVAKVPAARGGRIAPLLMPTSEGISMGTPRFFSPEQATGVTPDARSDVYTMGVVLYAMVTGKTPFEHLRVVEELLRAHAEAPPEPPSRLTAVPRGLEAAILKALAKRPEDRFAGAAAFAGELRRLAAPRSEYARLFIVALVASFLLAAAGTAAVHLARRPAVPSTPALRGP